MVNANTSKASEKLVENRLQELIHCARIIPAAEIEIHTDGIEITLHCMVATPLMRAAVSLQECYPDGGVYVVSRMGKLVLCVYYNLED